MSPTRPLSIITTDVRNALKSATFVGTHLTLNGQLSPTVYRKVNAVLEALGGTWDKKRKVHVFPTEPGPLVATALRTGSVERVDDKGFV